MTVNRNQIKKGKRQISGVNEEFLDSNLKVPGNNQHRPPISSFQKRPVDGLNKLPVVIDSFGAINILPTDKFGAVQEWDNRQSSSFGSTYSRRFENAEESTGSFNIAIDNKKLLEDARGKYHCIESGSLSVNESGCGKKLDHSTSAATSNISSRVYDGPYSSSTTYTCTLDERTSNDNDDESGGGPPIKRHCDSSRYVSNCTLLSWVHFCISLNWDTDIWFQKLIQRCSGYLRGAHYYVYNLIHSLLKQSLVELVRKFIC